MVAFSYKVYAHGSRGEDSAERVLRGRGLYFGLVLWCSMMLCRTKPGRGESGTW